MATASAYVLNVPADRRELLLDYVFGENAEPLKVIAQPVPRFSHSGNAPLVVLASFEDGVLTHVASGRKGVAAGTDLVRLNMQNLQPLRRPIPFDEISAAVSTRLRPHVERVLAAGGTFPPATLAAVVDVLTEIDPSIAPRLARFSPRRAEAVRRLSDRARDNLAAQKEALATALNIAGLSREEVLAWSPTEERPRSFLDGLPHARVREDIMIVRDFTDIPGFSAIDETTHYGARTFRGQPESGGGGSGPPVELTVIMANRLPLEEQTGADLIYYNETYRSFVMVQYKAMESANDGPEFRWTEADDLIKELHRMDEILAELAECDPDDDPDGFRLTDNPFFLKFCTRMVFNPDDKGLFSGMYLPLGLWRGLVQSQRMKGPRGGNVLTYRNVGRRVSNTEFVGLVANSWVGTTINQSAQLAAVVRSVLESGKTVTLAVKRNLTWDEYRPRDAAELPEPFDPAALFGM